MKRDFTAACLLAIAFAPTAAADEGAVRLMIRSKLGANIQIVSVLRVPDSGLFEVVIKSAEGARIYYVNERASLILSGDLFEAASGKNLTEESMQRLTAVDWKSLPFEWAVSAKRGSGRRKIAVFSDPNCPYCKRFERELAKLDDITVHIFLYPVIKPESIAQTKSVWCSKDRTRAWNDLMLRDIQPTAPPDCDTPIEKLVELGRRLGANSTPTWFLEDGRRFQGVTPPDEVRRLLDAASPPKR